MKKILIILVAISIMSGWGIQAHAQEGGASPEARDQVTQILYLTEQKAKFEKQLADMQARGENLASPEARSIVETISALSFEIEQRNDLLQRINDAQVTQQTTTPTAPVSNQTSGSGMNQNTTDGSGLNKNTTTSKTDTKTASQITASFDNPLSGVNSLADLFYKIINFIIGLSYVVIAAFYLLAGFKFVKAQGNPEELSEAKRAFFNTTVGAVIIIGINVITQVIESIIKGLQS